MVLLSTCKAALAASSLLLLLSTASAQDSELKLHTAQPRGCYSSSEPLQPSENATVALSDFQSDGLCQQACGKEEKPVFGLVNGLECYCGDLLPAEDTKIDDKKCNTPCGGYPEKTCGGKDRFQVFLTGIDRNEIEHFVASSSSTSASPTAAPQSTVVVTRPPSPTATEGGSSSSGASTAGIAGGVVAGVLATIAIVAGIFFFLRQRKRRAAEEAYKRGAAVSSFIENGKRPPMYANDNRLDPTAAQRRVSNGSIADNEDYSRRILKVTNPDGY